MQRTENVLIFENAYVPAMISIIVKEVSCFEYEAIQAAPCCPQIMTSEQSLWFSSLYYNESKNIPAAGWWALKPAQLVWLHLYEGQRILLDFFTSVCLNQQVCGIIEWANLSALGIYHSGIWIQSAEWGVIWNLRPH